MRFALLVLAAMLALTARASQVSYVAFEQVTVANASIGLTASKISPAATGGAAGSIQPTTASCRLETAEIRYTLDGTTTPTTTVGTQLETNDSLTITGHDLMANFRAIRTTGTSGVLNCHYFAP